MLKMYEEHPPTSLGNFSILQKKVHTKMPVSEGGWKCMKNSLPPPLSMHFNFKGWGMLGAILYVQNGLPKVHFLQFGRIQRPQT
jgi:hypothetical protein